MCIVGHLHHNWYMFPRNPAFLQKTMILSKLTVTTNFCSYCSRKEHPFFLWGLQNRPSLLSRHLISVCVEWGQGWQTASVLLLYHLCRCSKWLDASYIPFSLPSLHLTGFYGFVASLKYTDTKSLRLKLSLNYSDCFRLSEMMYDLKQSKINFTVH